MWQHVEQEAPYEIGCGEAQLFAEVAVSAVTVAEAHPAVLESHESFVADRDAMGVATQVGEHLCWSRHGRLAVDDPPFGGGLAEQALSQVRTHRCRPLSQRAVEEVEQLAPKHLGEGSNRHQEARPCRDPAIACGIQPAAGHDAMQVGMEEQGLRPGVQHRDRAWRRPQPSLAHRVERPDCRFEEQRVAAAPVGQEKSM